MTSRRSQAPAIWRAMRTAHARIADDGEQGGFALIFSLLLIFIVASLSIAVAGIVYNQVKPTQYERKSIATVNAAVAGLQVSIDQIRAANTTDAYGQLTGVLSQLRCTPSPATAASFSDSSGNAITVPGGTFTGYVNTSTGASASGGTLKFQTSIAYYQTDPSDQSLAWLQANAMNCPLSTAPAFAYLQTHGVVAGQTTVSGNRTQHATYTFKTSNQNVLGGRVVSFGSSPAMCIDAGTPKPSVGTQLVMQPCLALGTPQQSFSYRTDLTLLYQGAPSSNLCIQAPSSNGTVTLQKCVAPVLNPPVTGTPVTYPYVTGQQAQEWSFDDNGHFETAGSDGNVGGICLQPNLQADPNQAPPGTPVVTTGCSGSTNSLNAWNPDAQVGAGKAGGNIVGVPGAPTNQYVNYAEFGRCLDITGQNVDADHLIAYPCKQAPDSTKLTFNQVWTYNKVDSTYGTMTVNKGGTIYCLTAPSAASGYYITTKQYSSGTTPCSTSPNDAQLWQPTGVLTGNYPNSYELISKSLGMCMSSSTAPSGDLTPNSSNIIVETCNGTLREKWNAPPTNPLVGLSNISEDAGGANVGG